MAEYIVDTNVPLLAQGSGNHMSEDCIGVCAEFIENLLSNKGILVLDDDYLLIREYENNMRHGTNLDFGNRFLKWVYTNQANSKRVKQVHISVIDENNFEEVPQSIIDVNFDPADRKFIAVSIANENLAPIVEASDSKWIGWQKVLNQEGVKVDFLCKKELEATYKKKIRKGI